MTAAPIAAQPRHGLSLVLVLSMVRLFGRRVGTLDTKVPLRVDTQGDPVVAKVALCELASQKIGVMPTVDVQHVTMFLEGGLISTKVVLTAGPGFRSLGGGCIETLPRRETDAMWVGRRGGGSPPLLPPPLT